MNWLCVLSLALLASPCLFCQQKPATEQSRASKALTLADAIDQVRSSIVPITAIFADGTGSTGTGFIVNSDGIVVTARHVIRKANSNETPRIRIDIRTPAAVQGSNTFRGISLGVAAEIFAEDSAHDITVLKTSKNLLTAQAITIDGQTPPPARSFAKLEVRHLRDGEPVFSSGYPLNSLVLITNSGFIASSEPTDIEIRNGQFKLRDGYLLDLRLNHGNSGGPLFSPSSAGVIGFADQIRFADVEVSDNTQGTSYGIALQTPLMARSLACTRLHTMPVLVWQFRQHTLRTC